MDYLPHLNVLLGAGDDVLEEVDGHYRRQISGGRVLTRMHRRQIRPDVKREELVDLALGAKLGGK